MCIVIGVFFIYLLQCSIFLCVLDCHFIVLKCANKDIIIYLGYGWFLERVEVKDMTNLIKYVVPCERWLSSKETDQRTVRDFKVDYNIAFTPG